MIEQLENPEQVVICLRLAIMNLSAAFKAAGVVEGDQKDLNGRTRDIIFALNTAVDTLAEIVSEGIENNDVGKPDA